MGRMAICAAAAALALFCNGCRREDWREFEVETPALSAVDETRIKAALSLYEGVDRDSITLDTAGKKVKVRFDSMKVAQTNIRMALEAAGVKVVYPRKTGPAGYVNSRAPACPAPSR